LVSRESVSYSTGSRWRYCRGYKYLACEIEPGGERT
jgi:hypothetical protein